MLQSKKLTLTLILGVCAALWAGLLSAPPAVAGAPPSDPPGISGRGPAAGGQGGTDLSTVAPALRDKALPRGWRTSSDLAWTTDGDATGFHLLVAEARTGYTWRTAATLSEPWIESDTWVGNACVTASGHRAVVVYAPRHFTNRAHLFDRGAFAAVVDLRTGAVKKLGVTVSLAYYNPGCGAGESAVLTQSAVVDRGRTRLHVVDTARGTVVRSHEVAGEVTSAVPGRDGIVAASGARLVEVGRSGAVRTLASSKGVPYRIHPDAENGVVFTERHGSSAVVKRLSGPAEVRELARGPLTGVKVRPGGGGRVFVTGTPSRVGDLPEQVVRLKVPAAAEVSTAGMLSFTHEAPAPGAKAAAGAARSGTAQESAGPGTAEGTVLRAKVTATGAAVDFTVGAAERIGRYAAQGSAPSPVAPAAGSGRTAGRAGAGIAAESSSDPVDRDRTCAIARNDSRVQVYQPHWSQVEWAADLAVQKALTATRPANWKQSGMPASWSPQQMFPPVDLAGGGRVPAQILLGVMAQESNLWQASFHVAEGVTGNPLVGNYYGVGDGWGIAWGDADCGYGVAQVTDGMRLAGRQKPGETPLSPEKQLAVGVDYATNIAAGLRILQEKWNQTYQMNLRINGGNPARIESWFAALWAYNSGINPQASTGNTSGCTPSPTCTDADGNYGLGWTNNPARPDYPPDRAPFLDHNAYDDARNPQWWPYPEKVIGWAAYPIVKTTGGDNYEAGYAQAWWNTEELRSGAKPPLETFCSLHATDGNRCNPDNIGQGPNPCTRADAHCWWHAPVSWKNCGQNGEGCGHEADVLTSPGTPEPPDADATGAYPDEQRSRYAPRCSTGLPAGALLIDDVPDTVPVVRNNCSRSWTSSGSFALSFAQHSDGLYHSKVDFHQIGGGFGGHFWFTHSRTAADSAARSWGVTGTWTLNQPLNQWARVLVHMPDHGAHTQQAAYNIQLGNGQTRKRVMLQKTQRHEWVSLGAFPFAGTPSVSLNSVTADGDGTQDIAFDAVAFQPLAQKPAGQIVALGDSYSSGEGASQNAPTDYYQETDDSGTGGAAYRNGCHRSRHAWSRQAVLPGTSEAVGARADRLDPSMDYHLLACSGAQTENLLPAGVSNAFGETGRGQHRELSQLDRGFLDANTTMVTLNIGGNDAHFADVMRMCTIETPNPLDFCQYQQVTEPWLGQPVAGDLGQILPMLINGKVKESIATVLQNIRQKAPNARIVLSGYPRLAPPRAMDPYTRNADCMILTGLNELELDFLNDMSDLLNDVLHEHAVALSNSGIPVTYSDPRDEFELENVCSFNETIHRIILRKTEGEDPGASASSQSFHPTVAGARNYADAFVNTLRARMDGQGMPVPPSKEVAAAELQDLRGNQPGSSSGYQRSLFQHWLTTEGPCEVRHAVLRRDGTGLTPATGCPVTAGQWSSPYDGTAHTSPTTLTIDHVVSLKEAWTSGASRWTPEQRRTFANDQEHSQLLSVSVSSNSSKGERPPNVWLPALSHWCTYARSWIHTKHIYHLSVTDAEYDTLAEILNTRC
ncbi:DUF1524 domain-containing protein [Streptomyces sp. GMY02]|uniref:SGNH/GDSL hydrolase family protein n=1 Tax=Streptomyces sp. GMY02 TaxID=1333528 RepID=UPI001C2C5A39|nr:SGNH/GDSL hydrolase family protein [Streptomyces sp. GMY02]QXE33354.1 DUF1524 domain-containing protein [Streptomyces sp. GMY02]